MWLHLGLAARKYGRMAHHSNAAVCDAFAAWCTPTLNQQQQGWRQQQQQQRRCCNGGAASAAAAHAVAWRPAPMQLAAAAAADPRQLWTAHSSSISSSRRTISSSSTAAASASADQQQRRRREQQQHQHQPPWQHGGAAQADALGAYYRVPHDAPDDGDDGPRGIGSRRAAAALEAAIRRVLVADARARDLLVGRYGVCVHRVRLSPDRRTVHVLWDAHPGAAAAAEAALQRLAHRMRARIAKALRSRHTPYLAFRHDHLPRSAAGTAEALARAEAEVLAAAAAAAARKRAAAGAGAAAAAAEDEHVSSSSSGGETPAGRGGGAAAAASTVDAAIAELEARLPARKRYPRAWELARGGGDDGDDDETDGGSGSDWSASEEEDDFDGSSRHTRSPSNH